MQTITFTELRTKTKELARSLDKGLKVSLIYKSKIVGIIHPDQKKPKIFNAERFIKNVKYINLPKLTDKEIDQRYRKAMMEKHGKAVS